LSAASTLARAGKSVLVIEQRPNVGGYMSSFKRKDYHFEISHMAMESLGPGGHTHDLMTELGIVDKLNPIKLDPMYRIVYPNSTIDIPADPEKYKRLLIKLYPHEEKGITDLFDDLKSIYKCIEIVFPLKRGDYLSYMWAVITNPLPFWTLLKYKDARFFERIHEMILDYIKDPELLLTLCLYAGGLGADHLNLSGAVVAGFLAVVHYGGYYYIEGGGSMISRALVQNIEKNGGKILLSTRAEKIIIKDNRQF